MRQMMKLTAALLLAAPVAAHAVPVLDIQGGTLMGASGVDVNGTLYDVQFEFGTCVDVFDGCDEASDFGFLDVDLATAASQALLDQVLLDTAEGAFDSSPTLTNGCTFSDGCAIYTPSSLIPGLSLITVFAVNNTATDNSFPDGDFLGGSPTDTDADLVWAVWAPSATAVGEPATLVLMGLGLAGVGFSRRLRHIR